MIDQRGESIMTRRVFVFLFLMSLPVVHSVVADGADPDAAALVRRMAERYRNVTAYEFSSRVHLVFDAGEMGKQTLAGRSELIGLRPGFQRHDLRGTGMLDMTVVQTPDSTWQWMGVRNAYTVEPSASLLEGNKTAGDLSRYIRLGERAGLARIIGRQAIDGHDCTVIAFPADSATSDLGVAASIETLWVDNTDAVWRHVNDVTAEGAVGHVRIYTSMEFDKLDFDGSLDKSRFVFDPPAGATRMDEFPNQQIPTGEGMAGKAAADFSLQDLDGQAVSLAGLKGKVVVLDFWATWCGPCIIEMPRVIKLGEEFKNQDVVVLVITAESHDIAKNFLTGRKLNVRCLLDGNGKVNEAYGVEALPTLVVIDRAGMISDYFVGVRTEDVLRTAIQKARAE
jgi:thiol-disulfide isomerase/thioredoxin